MTPVAQRSAVAHLQESHGVSQRRACEVLQVNRRTARHRSRRLDDVRVRQRLKELAEENSRWGYRLLGGRLRLDGFLVNHKRVLRLYQEEKLQHRPRSRKRIKGDKRGHPPEPTTINEVWTLDFMSDNLWNGRTIRTLNVLDAFTRQCHCIEIDTSLAGARVQRVLADLITRHGKPSRLQIDNGPEFRCNGLRGWCEKEEIELYFIDPGKPNQNSRIESFNSRFREECLNQEWFITVAEARRTTEAWRRSYNEYRPHSSLKYLPPNQWTREHLARLQQSGEAILPLPNSKSQEGTDGSAHSVPSGSIIGD